MIQNLEQIEYRRGMIEFGMMPNDLPNKVFRGEQIPAEVRKSIDEENLLDLAGVYGDIAAGDPVQYDHLRLVLTDETVAIIVFNRAITLIFADDERVRRIHRVLCKLDRTEKR